MGNLLAAAQSLEGQLTATIHASEQELKSWEDLIAILETKAGRPGL
jgi:2,5-dioxopentanoate dehydrogenase